MTEKTVILRAGGQRPGPKPVRVVVVMNWRGIAGGIVPACVHGARAHDAGEEHGDCASGGTTKHRADETHEAVHCTLTAISLSKISSQREASCTRT